MAAPSIETTPAWGNYVDLQNDVKPWLGYPPGTPTDDVKLQAVTDMACYWAQDYLGRPIAPTTFFRRFSGWSGMNGAYVSLPYYPVLSVVSVTEWWGTSGAHVLTEQTPASQGGQDVYQMDYLRGTVIRSFMGLVQRPWFPGSRNIEIEWVAGYNPVPPTFRIGTLELVKYWWENSQEASRSFAVPAGAGEYGGPISISSHLMPAVPPRVIEMFQTAVQVGIG